MRRTDERTAFIEPLEVRKLLAFNPISAGGTTYDSASKVASTPDGGSIVAGIFSGTADFDPTSGKALLTAVGDTDIFIARYSASGTLVYAKQFGGAEGDFKNDKAVRFAINPDFAGNYNLGVGINPEDLGEYVTGLTTDSAGNAYLVGAFRGAVDFDPGQAKLVFTSTGGKNYLDTFFLKLNTTGGLVFAKQIGGDFTDIANGIALDASNNIYLTGYFTRTADFDPSSRQLNLDTEENGREDIFVAKYNSSGNVVWAIKDQTDEIDRAKRSAGNAIAVDGSGNVVVTGSFSGRTNFSTTASKSTLIKPQGDTDVFIQKLSASSGSTTWVKTFGGDDYDGGDAVALGADGSIYTGAYFQRTIDADPGTAIVNVSATPEKIGEKPKRTDLLFSKFDSNGALRWAKPIGGYGWETLGNIAVDSSGSLYATGAFYGPVDFDPGRAKHVLTSVLGVDHFKDINDNDRDYSYDGFLLKLSAVGNFVFANQFGGAGDDFSTDLTLNDDQQPLIAGQFRGTYVFPGTNVKLRPIGAQDAFDALFDTDGSIL